MRFIAELYLPAGRSNSVDELDRRAATGARELAAQGIHVSLAGSTLVPEDEMVLLHYEADTREFVLEAIRCAGLTSERVVEAIETARPAG
jgi:hypothetical protein